MKYFGFISEHDNNKNATSIKDLIGMESTENAHRKEVIQYLRKGLLCVPFMGCVENANDPNFNTDDYDDDNFIAYRAIHTDGKWLWPEYIVEYLEKYPDIKIDEAFINHVIKNKEANIKLSEEELSKIEKEYLNKEGFK